MYGVQLVEAIRIKTTTPLQEFLLIQQYLQEHDLLRAMNVQIPNFIDAFRIDCNL